MTATGGSIIAAAKRTLRRFGLSPEGATAAPEFADLCDDAVLRCLAAGNMTWLENAFGPSSFPTVAEAAHALRHLVVRHLLKEAGDASGAAAILEGLQRLGLPEDAEQKFFRLLCRYAARELEATAPALPLPRLGGRNAVSVVVWGDAYIDRFNRYCLASLAAPGNMPALKASGRVTLLVYTAARDAAKIRGLESIRRLGVGLRIWTIPDDLLELASGDLKYWMLGALQSIHLFHAARRGANFLPIFPDGIYADDYIASILEAAGEGVDAVFQGSFKAYRSKMLAALEPFLSNGVYAVPPQAMLELALQHVHPHIVACFIDPSSPTVPAHRMLWAHCGDYLEVRSPHYNAALLRNSVIGRIRPRYLMTLDSELDKLLPHSSRIHFRSIEDRYFGTELVDEPTDPLPRLGFEDYARFFVQHAKAAHLRFERTPYRIAIRPEWFAALAAASPREVTACFERIAALIEDQLRIAGRFDRVDLVLEVLDRLAQKELTAQQKGLVARAREAVAGMR